MTVLLAVNSTRHTAIGTFRPGVVYAVDDGPIQNRLVVSILTTGKDLQGKPAGAGLAGKVLTEEEAKAYLQGAFSEPQKIGEVSEEDPDSIDLDVLETLQSQLRTAENQVVETMKSAKAAEEQGAQKQADLEEALQVERSRADAAERKAEDAMGRENSAIAAAQAAEAELAFLRQALEEAKAQSAVTDQPSEEKPEKGGSKK